MMAERFINQHILKWGYHPVTTRVLGVELFSNPNRSIFTVVGSHNEPTRIELAGEQGFYSMQTRKAVYMVATGATGCRIHTKHVTIDVIMYIICGDVNIRQEYKHRK